MSPSRATPISAAASRCTTCASPGDRCSDQGPVTATPETPAAPGRWRDLIGPTLAPRAALVMLGVWLNAADSLVTATIMPSVARDLGGYAYFGWAVAGYLLGSILAGASAGQISHRLGLRPAMVLAALAYAGGR